MENDIEDKTHDAKNRKDAQRKANAVVAKWLQSSDEPRRFKDPALQK